MMDYQEIRDGNELIKDFMGSTIKMDQDDVKDIPLAFLKIPDMKFHLAWKWLMPVVIKIEEDEGHIVRIEGKSCEVVADDDKFVAKAETKIEAVWKVVVAFLDSGK